jgi:ribosomal protein S18 acetylase RimI-like enzyme
VAYRFVNAVPTLEEHSTLAVAVGWQDALRWEAMPASLAASVCGVVAYADDGQPVAMGRVVGDGAFYFYIQDVAVHPDHRRQGLGREVMRRLRSEILERSGGDCFVGLFSTPAAVELYAGERFGTESMTGMWQVLRPA